MCFCDPKKGQFWCILQKYDRNLCIIIDIIQYVLSIFFLYISEHWRSILFLIVNLQISACILLIWLEIYRQHLDYICSQKTDLDFLLQKHYLLSHVLICLRMIISVHNFTVYLYKSNNSQVKKKSWSFSVYNSFLHHFLRDLLTFLSSRCIPKSKALFRLTS